MVKAESNAQIKKVNTETITFRLPSNLIDGLRKEAESDKISLNSLVTKISNGKSMKGRLGFCQ
jgi:predicted HicB family RNase H-like nuclease